MLINYGTQNTALNPCIYLLNSLETTVTRPLSLKSCGCISEGKMLLLKLSESTDSDLSIHVSTNSADLGGSIEIEDGLCIERNTITRLKISLLFVLIRCQVFLFPFLFKCYHVFRMIFIIEECFHRSS